MLVTNADNPGTALDEAAIRRELAELCAAFGKSDGSRRLLTYLVECHLRGSVPRETDVALDVFRRDASFDGTHDAVVRVAARSLRQKMEEYYRGAGKERPLHFELPRGSYRIVITAAADAESPAAGAALEPQQPEGAVAAHTPASPPMPPATGTRRFAAPLMLALSVLLLAASALLFMQSRREGAVPKAPGVQAAMASPVWQPLFASERPILIVLGDLLLFPNPHTEAGRMQLLRDSRINTREQLRDYLGSLGLPADGEPVAGGDPGVQVATTLVPMSVAYGLVQLLPIVTATGRPVEVRVLDELQLDKLRTYDVIYMGPLVSIGPLKDAVFLRSHYTFALDEYTRILRNEQSGKEFRPTRGRRENAEDYGFFASFRGPEGNRVMVLSSVGSDLGLVPLMREMTSASGLAGLQRLAASAGNPTVPENLEAVMKVHGYYRTDLAASWVEAAERPAARTR